MILEVACDLELPLTHIAGAFVAFATRNDIAISSQFLLLDESHT